MCVCVWGAHMHVCVWGAHACMCVPGRTCSGCGAWVDWRGAAVLLQGDQGDCTCVRGRQDLTVSVFLQGCKYSAAPTAPVSLGGKRSHPLLP